MAPSDPLIPGTGAINQARRRRGARFVGVTAPLHLESSVQAAREAGLRYVTDSAPGVSRHGSADNFSYRAPDGSNLVNADELARIKSLAVPPAWSDVWIATRADAHLQATGRDLRGRKQYRYHPDFRASRDTNKFDRMLDFARALPRIRRHVSKDLRRGGLPREKVLAAVIRLLERTHIRVGNDEYAKTNGSFGLTTFRNHHAKVKGSTVRFEFRGKSGIRHAIDIQDPAIARLVRTCQDLPGQQLFTYTGEDGTASPIGSEDVNAYLREITGDTFTAKDFRTWAGTVAASIALRAFEPFNSETEAKRNVVQAIAAVAKRLGNTPAVCRKCYIHPAIVEAYLHGHPLPDAGRNGKASRYQALEERSVIALLRQHSAAGSRNRSPSGGSPGKKTKKRPPTRTPAAKLSETT